MRIVSAAVQLRALGTIGLKGQSPRSDLMDDVFAERIVGNLRNQFAVRKRLSCDLSIFGRHANVKNTKDC